MLAKKTNIFRAFDYILSAKYDIKDPLWKRDLRDKEKIYATLYGDSDGEECITCKFRFPADKLHTVHKGKVCHRCYLEGKYHTCDICGEEYINYEMFIAIPIVRPDDSYRTGPKDDEIYDKLQLLSMESYYNFKYYYIKREDIDFFMSIMRESDERTRCYVDTFNFFKQYYGHLVCSNCFESIVGHNAAFSTTLSIRNEFFDFGSNLYFLTKNVVNPLFHKVEEEEKRAKSELRKLDFECSKEFPYFTQLDKYLSDSDYNNLKTEADIRRSGNISRDRKPGFTKMTPARIMHLVVNGVRNGVDVFIDNLFEALAIDDMDQSDTIKEVEVDKKGTTIDVLLTIPLSHPVELDEAEVTDVFNKLVNKKFYNYWYDKNCEVETSKGIFNIIPSITNVDVNVFDLSEDSFTFVAVIGIKYDKEIVQK